MLWNSFNVTQFAKLKSIEIINEMQPNPSSRTISNDFKITNDNKTLKFLKVKDNYADYDIENILKIMSK